MTPSRSWNLRLECCNTTDPTRRAGTLKKLKAVPLVEIGKLVGKPFFNGFLCFLLRHYSGNMSGNLDYTSIHIHWNARQFIVTKPPRKPTERPPKMVFLKCFVFSLWNESSKNSAEEILGHFNTPAV